MKNLNLLLIGMVATLPLAAKAGIATSPHDFSTSSWNTRKGICTPCHQAHHTDENQLVPLWAHATTTQTYRLYDSPTLDATVGQPQGASLACLSCHDGTLAVNQSIGQAVPSNPQYVTDEIGGDGNLHTTHPISFTYDKTLANVDGGLLDPTVYKIGDPIPQLPNYPTAPVPPTWQGTSLTGKTIQQALLINDKVECSSCHDVHKQEGSAPGSGILVRISGTDSGGRGSLICRNCHIK